MNRPKIKMIKECVSIVDNRILQGTIMHLIEYIEFLEEELEAMQLEYKVQDTLNSMGGE